MNRRAFLGGLVATSGLAVAEPVLAGQQKLAPHSVVVYHFVTPGCKDCDRWDQRYLPRFLNSGEFRRSAYRRIEGKTRIESLDPRRWPSEARPFAASLQQTPAFVVLRQGRGVAAASGEDAWTQVIWPAIQRAAA
jgi:hypothetical protein